MMSSSRNKISIPTWFSKELDGKQKELVKESLVSYIISRGLQDKYPPAVKETYFCILPEMAKLDKKWLRVNEENFNPNKFRALGDYQTTIKNYLKSKSLQE